MAKHELDISVVLTAYKRIDLLQKQLDAVKNQSVKPKEILLFQDCIPAQYQIVLNKEMLDQFDAVYIAQKNEGVWGRFRFAARQAVSKYVCIFDDDTVPGKRWLENCCCQMKKKEGIYGTIGIVFARNTVYPDGGYYSVGWRCPNSVTREVDFAGHSWFLKKEWISYMFDGTEKYQALKYAGEDMCLSFSCQKHGIKTYVPPHPEMNLDYWGAEPGISLAAGASMEALSRSGNDNKMRTAVQMMIHDGWKTISETRQDYVKEISRIDRKYYAKKLIRKAKLSLHILSGHQEHSWAEY